MLDACDQARLSEGWEVFGGSLSLTLITLLDVMDTMTDTGYIDEVLNSPRLLNLPLLLLANKQDSPTSLSVSEIRESFDAWQRAHPERRRAQREAEAEAESGDGDTKGKGKGKAKETDEGPWHDDGAVEERMASLDVLGVSALEG